MRDACFTGFAKGITAAIQGFLQAETTADYGCTLTDILTLPA